MELGFVSAILPDLSLEQVFDTARDNGYDSVEVMCWPPGKAERRYAGVTHIDVREFTQERADQIKALMREKNVGISGLGYYPNILAPSAEEREVSTGHLKKVIVAAGMIGLDTVSTFIGRNWKLTVDENWPMFLSIWPDLIKFAEDHGVRIAIENCAMFFGPDEWPGGKNLAYCPAIWDRMFDAIPSRSFGLNYDPSHPVWMGMDYMSPLQDYAGKIFRIHLKDVVVDKAKLNRVGILAYPHEYHTPVLPGMGQIDWTLFFAGLREIGYDGYATVEAEDRRYEEDGAHRKQALALCSKYLRPFIAG
ncbi:MAG: sugar phosphate isomerase/epimerase [Acidobacteria bacterium]|nr:sugar phosphate isomerase/epimerase [Acidobacteriota bacterium]